MCSRKPTFFLLLRHVYLFLFFFFIIICLSIKSINYKKKTIYTYALSLNTCCFSWVWKRDKLNLATILKLILSWHYAAVYLYVSCVNGFNFFFFININNSDVPSLKFWKIQNGLRRILAEGPLKKKKSN